MRFFSSVILMLVATTSSLAQTVPPALFAPGKTEDLQALTLKRVEVDAKVTSLLSETKTTMTFCNSLNRVLEGTLHFPLPEGATVSGYALDVNGELVDGVIVEKNKGQVVFEKEVRKGIDPGLIEWTKGNNFKTRVYPIPAKGCRIVSVSFVSPLNISNGRGNYILPLNFKDTLAEFSLRMTVAQSTSAPRVTWPGPGGIQLQKKDNSWVAETNLRGQPLVGQLVLALPDASQTKILVEETPNHEIHFLIHDILDEKLSQIALATSNQPSKISILWDISGSRQNTNHTKEIKVLETLFSRFEKNALTVELIPFCNVAQPVKSFTVRNGKADELLAAIRSLSYDGGTQMAAISPLEKAAVPDFYLLFSDGLSNFGSAEAKGFKAPVYAFSEDLTLNALFLKWLTQKTGGDFFNLNSTKPEQAAASIGGARLAIMSITATSGGIDQVFPRIGEPVQNILMITGKFNTHAAKLVVELGIAGQVKKRLEYKVTDVYLLSGDLVARQWAQQKVNELAVFPDQNYQALLEIGKKYGLVTPATSLIVLENLDQYVEHEIQPPASLKKMQANYNRLMAERTQQQKRETQEKLSRIIELWEQRVAWWKKKFAYPKNFRVHDEDKKEAVEERVRDDEVQMSAAPEPMMKPESAADSAGLARGAPAASEATAKSKSDDHGAQGPSQASIELAPWTPDTPYLHALQKAKTNDYFSTYLEQKKIYGTAPAFFLDCADFFAKQKQPVLSLQILSNVAELELDNAALLRVLGHRLRQLGYLDLAAMIFKDVLRLRPEEPQSYRDLALVLSDQEKYEDAMQLFAHVVMNQWEIF